MKKIKNFPLFYRFFFFNKQRIFYSIHFETNISLLNDQSRKALRNCMLKNLCTYDVENTDTKDDIRRYPP